MKVGNNAPVTIEPVNQEPAGNVPAQNPQSPGALDPFAKDSIEITPADNNQPKPAENPDEKKPWYDRFIPKTNSAWIKTIAAASGIAVGVTTALLVSALAGPALPLVILAGFAAAGLGANIAVTTMAFTKYGQDSTPIHIPTKPNPHFKPGEPESTDAATRESVARGPQLTAPDSNPNLRNPADLEPATRKPADGLEIPTPDAQALKDAESIS